jgi:hypothetical protein
MFDIVLSGWLITCLTLFLSTNQTIQCQTSDQPTRQYNAMLVKHVINQPDNYNVNVNHMFDIVLSGWLITCLTLYCLVG